MNSKFKALIKAAEPQNYPNRLNTPKLVRLRRIQHQVSSIRTLESRILGLESSTTVEKPLQINSFMQNKANFPDNQMNVNKVLTKDYENIPLCRRGENKPNTNPIKPNPPAHKPRLPLMEYGCYG